MTAKKFLTVLLLVFVGASIVYLVVAERGGAPKSDVAEDVVDVAELPAHQVQVYYFHWTARCKTCLAIEANAKESLDSNFADLMASGEITWQAVNVEQPVNEHYIKDYKLTASSLVVVDTYNQTVTDWKNLDRVWDLSHNKPAFIEYVRDETMAFLQDEG